jgi:mRNA-degrading endonuclease toxin of MazEF toxin-antitoxin module
VRLHGRPIKREKVRDPGHHPGRRASHILESEPINKSSTRATAPGKIRPAVIISPKLFRRLGAACLAESMTQSEIVELMINRLLSGYVVSVHGDRIGSVANLDRSSQRPEINLAVAPAA